jgi:hypothetical protein
MIASTADHCVPLCHLILTTLRHRWRNCNPERMTCPRPLSYCHCWTTLFSLLLRHLYSRGWQRCSREVSGSRCTNWRWCGGDSGLTSNPFCRLSQRHEWHWTDLQQGLLIPPTAAHMHLRFKMGVGIPAHVFGLCVCLYTCSIWEYSNCENVCDCVTGLFVLSRWKSRKANFGIICYCSFSNIL